MGVPQFFSYILNNYPAAVTSKQDQAGLKLDMVYLDGNALLYPIADTTKIPEEIAWNLLQVAQSYARYYRCKCSIYMDGPAHMAKIRQQRLRRFLYDPTIVVFSQVTEVGERVGEVPVPSTVKSEVLGYDVPAMIEWSPAMFTPGTQMMESIHQYVLAHIREYKDIEIYSSFYEAGEGEHKIIKHIKDTSLLRSRQNPYRAGIVGKDADLLLLSMGITTGEGWNVQPYVIRHNDRLGDSGKSDGYTPEDPIYTVDCSMLRERILASFSLPQSSIWNFIVSTFIMGNDFFPSIPELSDVYRTIPIILSISPNLYVKNTVGGHIDWSGMHQFLIRMNDIINSDVRMRSSAYEKWLQLPSKDTDPKDFNIQSSRITTQTFEPLYYFYASSFTVDKESVVLSWMTTAQWIFLYYHDGIDATSIAWQYPLHFSPTLYTLVSSTLLTDVRTHERVHSLSTRRVPPITPVQSLASVLPVWLHNLIPAETRKRVSSASQYYPYAFEMQTSTGDPIIPTIPYEVASSL